MKKALDRERKEPVTGSACSAPLKSAWDPDLVDDQTRRPGPTSGALRPSCHGMAHPPGPTQRGPSGEPVRSGSTTKPSSRILCSARPPPTTLSRKVRAEIGSTTYRSRHCRVRR
jgi:hypothetical protein